MPLEKPYWQERGYHTLNSPNWEGKGLDFSLKLDLWRWPWWYTVTSGIYKELYCNESGIRECSAYGF